MGRHVVRMGDREGMCRALVGRPAEQKPLERPRHRWEENVKMVLQEVGWGDRDWIDLA